MTSGSLMRRLERLPRPKSTRRRTASEKIDISNGLKRDDSERLAGVVEAMLRAGLLDRYCVRCSRRGRIQALFPVADRIFSATWPTPMPWDKCASCGSPVK